MKLHKYTEDQLREAVKQSTSMRQVLMKLGVTAYGGNYIVLKKAIKVFKLDVSHFTGCGWSKGLTRPPKRKIDEYLSNKHTISSHKLRLRLLKEKLFIYQCSCCKRKTWLNVPIPLELDHIDGNHQNNDIENLRLLCPNCHAMTPTHCGKNKSRKI